MREALEIAPLLFLDRDEHAPALLRPMRVDPAAVVVTRGNVALPPPVPAPDRFEPAMQRDAALQLAEHPIDRGALAIVGEEGEDTVAHELDTRKGLEKRLDLGGEEALRALPAAPCARGGPRSELVERPLQRLELLACALELPFELPNALECAVPRGRAVLGTRRRRASARARRSARSTSEPTRRKAARRGGTPGVSEERRCIGL